MRSSVPRPRDSTVDVLRGLAIVAMVLGHLATRIVVPRGAGYIEVLGGTAPPLFLIVVGMMVAHSTWANGQGGGHFVRRGAILLGAGALLDVAVVRIRPFTSVDVLYLIGASLPIAWLVTTRVPATLRGALALAMIFAAPPLQDRLGYADYPTEILAGGRLAEAVDVPGIGQVPIDHRTDILHHWIVDGWFPVFPWLGFVLLGTALAAWRWPGAAGDREGEARRIRPFGARDALLPGLALVGAAVAGGWLGGEWVPTPRSRYGGAFMPPRGDYLAASLGIVLLLGWAVDHLPRNAVTREVERLGRHAITVYLVQGSLLAIVGHFAGDRVSHPRYLATGLGVLLVLDGVAWVLDRAMGQSLLPPSIAPPGVDLRRTPASPRSSRAVFAFRWTARPARDRSAAAEPPAEPARHRR